MAVLGPHEADGVQRLALVQGLLPPAVGTPHHVQGQVGGGGGRDLAQGAVVRGGFDVAPARGRLHPALVLPARFVRLQGGFGWFQPCVAGGSCGACRVPSAALTRISVGVSLVLPLSAGRPEVL